MLDRDKLIALHLEALAELGWVPPAMEDVIDQILRELLPLGLAGDVFECSDEKLRKLCELTVGTKRPLGPPQKEFRGSAMQCWFRPYAFIARPAPVR